METADRGDGKIYDRNCKAVFNRSGIHRHTHPTLRNLRKQSTQRIILLQSHTLGLEESSLLHKQTPPPQNYRLAPIKLEFTSKPLKPRRTTKLQVFMLLQRRSIKSTHLL